MHSFFILFAISFNYTVCVCVYFSYLVGNQICVHTVDPSSLFHFTVIGQASQMVYDWITRQEPPRHRRTHCPRHKLPNQWITVFTQSSHSFLQFPRGSSTVAHDWPLTCHPSIVKGGKYLPSKWHPPSIPLYRMLARALHFIASIR